MSIRVGLERGGGVAHIDFEIGGIITSVLEWERGEVRVKGVEKGTAKETALDRPASSGSPRDFRWLPGVGTCALEEGEQLLRQKSKGIT